MARGPPRARDTAAMAVRMATALRRIPGSTVTPTTGTGVSIPASILIPVPWEPGGQRPTTNRGAAIHRIDDQSNQAKPAHEACQSDHYDRAHLRRAECDRRQRR